MKPWMENLIVAAAIILITGLLPGCTSMLIGNALSQGQNLTPEQIEQYQKTGSAVYGCFQVGGPPPVGNTQWVVLPHGSPAPKFGDNCHIIQ